MKNYSQQEIDLIKQQLITDFTYWYHKIDLGNGIVTPGFDYDPLWDNVRSVRNGIDSVSYTHLTLPTTPYV